MLQDAGIALVGRPADVMDDTIVAGLGPNAVVAEMHEDRIPDMVQQMVQAGIQVEGVQRIQPTLEQLFLKMTEGESIE